MDLPTIEPIDRVAEAFFGIDVADGRKRIVDMPRPRLLFEGAENQLLDVGGLAKLFDQETSPMQLATLRIELRRQWLRLPSSR